MTKALEILLAAGIGLAVLNRSNASGQSADEPAPVSLSGAPVTTIPQAGSSAANVLSGEEIQIGEITAPRDLTAESPNVAVFDSDDQRMPKFTVRGFRENNFGAGAPVVGLYVDDVPYFDLDSRGLQLFDTRDIQFVRGGQGTLYGAAGVGGVINIQTRQPDNDTHGYLEGSYGNYDAQAYQLGLGGPLLTNKLFFGLDGIYTLRDGFVYNNMLDDHPDTQNTEGVRGTLRWTPSYQWAITLSADAARDNDGLVATYDPLTDPNPFSINRHDNGYVDTDNVDEAFKIAWQGDSVKVTSISAHREWRQNLSQDFSFGEPYLVEGFSSPRLEQWSEELRVESPEASGSPLEWRTGLYFLSNDQHTDSGTESFIVPVTTLTTLARLQEETYALFGQGTYAVFEHLDLTGGVRLTDDERAISRVGTDSPSGAVTGAYDMSQEFTAFEPKFAAVWHFTPKLETYGSVTGGYQSGGFNPSVNSAAWSAYGPERDWQFELGAKSSWLENKLAVNGDLFYTAADNYQTYRINPLDPTQAYLLNAPRATLEGAELELTARPMEDLDLSAGAGYTEADYDRFTEAPAASGTGDPLNLDGKPISFVPEFTANLTARYRLPRWHLYLQGEVIGVGRYQLDDSGTVTTGTTVQKSYFLANAQAGYAGGHYSLYLFAKNIFDTHYDNNALNLGGGPLILQPGDPVTFGFAASAQF